MHPWADLFRWGTVVLLLVCCVAVPVGIGQVIRPPRTWLLLLGLDLLLIGRISSTFGRMGAAIVWYGAPLTAVATALLTWYSVEAIVQERRRRRKPIEWTGDEPGLDAGWQKPVAPPREQDRPKGLPPRE